MPTPKSFVPDAPSSFVEDTPSSSSDFTSNPLHPDESPRYQKDFSHQGGGPTLLEKAKSVFAAMTAPIPDAPMEWHQPGGHTVGGFVRSLPAALTNVGNMVPNTINAAARGVAGMGQLPSYVGETLEMIHNGDPQGIENLYTFTPPGMAQVLLKQYKDDSEKDGVDQALSNLAGNLLAMKFAGKLIEKSPELVGPATAKLKETVAKTKDAAVRGATGTGPQVMRELVKETQKNKDLVAKKTGEISTEDQTKAAGTKNQDEVASKTHKDSVAAARDKANADHEAAQKEYFRKQAEHKAETERTEAENKRLTQEHEKAVEKHGQTQSSLNENERSAKVELGKVEERVHDEADNLYKELKPKLQDEDVDPKTADRIATHGIDNMSAAESKPPLLEKFEKALKNSSPTYGVYDEFRSKIGNAMRKGGLSGTTYHIYEMMLEGDPENGIPGIVDEMDKIAKKEGLSEEAAAARSAWRDWAQAFRDRSSPLHNILADPESHGMLGAMRGRKSYLARLRAFGEDGSKLADQIEKDLNTAQGSKAKFTPYGTIEVPKPKPPVLGRTEPFSEREPQYKAPQTKPAPTPSHPVLTSGSAEERARNAVGKPTDIGTEDIRRAKRESMLSKSETLSGPASKFISNMAAFGVIEEAMRGGIPAAARIVGARVIYGLGRHALATLLRNESVLKLITEPTAYDIAHIPENMRGPLKEITEEARKQGIKVDPKVLALIGASAAIPRGPKSQELQKIADEYRQNSTQQ
jgi:hypothetical protein